MLFDEVVFTGQYLCKMFAVRSLFQYIEYIPLKKLDTFSVQLNATVLVLCRCSERLIKRHMLYITVNFCYRVCFIFECLHLHCKLFTY